MTRVGLAVLSTELDGGRTLLDAPRVRAASIVKPLLAWATASMPPFAGSPETWTSLAQPAITMSDNAATAELWARAGGERTLTALQERAGVRWEVDDRGGEHESLRLLVTAGEVASAYRALVDDPSDAGLAVRRWMREVPAVQTFGLRPVARDALAVPESSVGVKCGWFGGERVHAVVLLDLPDRTIGAVCTTDHVPDDDTVAAVRGASGDDTALAGVHDAVAGPTIRAAIRSALVALRH